MNASDVRGERCRQFWSWFAREEYGFRAAFAAALERSDYRSLEGIVNAIGGQLARIEPGLAVRLNGGKPPAPFRLAIQAPDPAQRGTVQRLLADAPALPGWTFGEEIEVPPQNVIVRDDRGDELVVAYRDVRFRLLPPKPDGSVSILFVMDGEFDPQGPRGHLYQAVASEILKNAFGGAPPGMGSYALVPASWVDQSTVFALGQLRAAWDQLRRS